MKNNPLWHPFIFGFILFPLSALLTIPLMPRDTSPLFVTAAMVLPAVLMASTPEIIFGVKWLSRRCGRQSALG